MYKISKKFKKVCQICGKEFYAPRANTRFCSNYCTHRYYYLKNKENKNYDYVKKICKNCGKEFKTESYKVNQKYCCEECRNIYYKNHRKSKSIKTDDKINTIKNLAELKVKDLIYKASNNGNYFNNITLNYDISSDIPKSVRDFVLDRDHNKCQICSSRDKLHIHHIIKRINGGNHDPSNLITLCSSCHRYIHIGDLSYAIPGCCKNAEKVFLNSGKINTIDRYEIEQRLNDIFDQVKNNYTNCENLLISINELIDQI